MNYFAVEGSLYQWDTGRRVTLTLPYDEYASVVEFSVNNEAEALVVSVVDNVAWIPNKLLQRSGSLKMWAVAITADGRQTRRYASRAIIPRPKPDDYVYTETEVLDWRRLEGEIDALEERVEHIETNGGGGGINVEKDPTVPAWAKQPDKPVYTAAEVGAATKEEVERLTEENAEIREELDAISNLETTTGDTTVKVTGWTSGRIDSGEHKNNAAIAYSEIMPCVGQAFHFDSAVYKMMYIRYNADGTKGTVGSWVTESPLVVSAHTQPNVRVQVYTIDASKITDAMLADLPNQVTYTVPGQGEETAKVPIVQAVLGLSAANVPPRYVDGVTGSDNNPGTADAPFATIQKGVDSGTKLLYVEPGEYAEYVRITNRDELTIMPTAYPRTYDITAPETPMIHITGTEDSRIGRALYITNCGKISIIGVWGDYTTYETIHAINVKDLTMIGCYASNGASEMSAFKTNNTNAVFRRCKAWNAGKDGFGLSGHGDVSLYDCIAHDCADDGVSHHNSNTGIIVGGEFYNCGKGGVSSPTYGAYIDIIGVYSHDNVYGLYAMNDMDRRESVGKICGCVFINNTTADLRIGQNCRVTGWNNVYQTKSVMDAATYVELGATTSE